MWRYVVNNLHGDEFLDWPVEGPRTVLWLMKMFAKASLSPTAWLEKFLATAKWSEIDRSAHDMRSLAEYFETAGCYDQLNLAALAHMELLARRWQVIMEAHQENPTAPDYDAADYMSGAHAKKHGVCPALRAHAARLMKDDAEVKKQLSKVRELRPAKPNEERSGWQGEGLAGPPNMNPT